MEVFGVYNQIQIICLNSLMLIASLCYATVNQQCHAHIKYDFKLFLVISDTSTYSNVVDQECSPSECNTLAYFMNHSTDYFKSNELYQFQAGTHTPLDNSTVNIAGVRNLILCGPNFTNESALINCSGASVAFLFENSSNIIIKDLSFDHCAPAQDFHSDSVYYHGYAVLVFRNNTDIYLSRLSLSQSIDEAFYIQDTIGELHLRELRVTHSNTAEREIESAGNAIVYRTCSEQVSQFILEDSCFSNNSNLAQTDLSKCPTPSFSKGGIPQGGGLSIRIQCGNVNISIRNLKMVGNAGGDGGNLELAFEGSPSFAAVEIINSHFESGYGLEGGGMRITVLPSAVFTTNVAFHSINYHTTGYYHQQSPQFQIILEYCEFYGNFAHDGNQRSGSGTGVIFTKSNEYFELNSCTVHDNNSTGVLSISSNIIASGNIIITDNKRGSSGGGILLCLNAIMLE
jgi:hypothetical protein